MTYGTQPIVFDWHNRGVLFDFDGTLASTDTECFHYMASSAFKKFGLQLSDEELDRFWYDKGREITMKEEYGIDPEEYWVEYRKRDTPEFRRKHTKLYPDVMPFISYLKENGFKLGIVTGAPKHMLEIGLDMIGRENIDAAVRAQLTSGVAEKPSPSGLWTCLTQMGVYASRAIYIGNGWEDVFTGKNAGVLDVALIRNENEYAEQKVIEARPSVQIYSLENMQRFIEILSP